MTDARPPDDAKKPTPGRCLVVINELAGGVAAAGDEIMGLHEWLTAAGFDAQVFTVTPERVLSLVREHLRGEPTLFVIGGGDGSLRGVAGLLTDTEHVLGILPLGTLNRFARALGIPNAFDEAVEVLINGRDRAVDLGEAGTEVFLNTCVFGLYPELAGRREARRARHRTWPKLFRWLLDTTAAAWEVSRSWHLIRFRLQLDARTLAHRVPALFVSNNPLPPLRRERSLDQGLLGIYIPRVDRPLHLLWLTAQTLVREPKKIETLEVLFVKEVVVDTRPIIPIALDGEVVRLKSASLRVRSRPGACRVRVPPTKKGH